MRSILFLASFLAVHASALPITSPSNSALPSDEAYNFNGIAKLSNCSGSLFKFEGQSPDSKALILTNGHCVKMMDPNEVVVGQSTFRTFKLYNRKSSLASVSFPAEKIVYGVMKDTDMAIYQLKATYAELANDHEVDALVMDSELGTIGDSIAVVSGYFKSTSSCTLEAFVHELREGDWTFTDSLRYSPECKVIHGTSGSPVVSLTTGQIVGVNNTVYENGEACTLNNPCEVDAEGNITTIKDRGYGQQTYQVHSCLNSDFQIDLSLESCELPKPSRFQRSLAEFAFPTLID